jgi:hypothetical protein
MRLEVGKQVSPKSIAHKGIDLDGLVHTMNEARGRSQIIIRSLEVRDLLSHNDNDPLQERGVALLPRRLKPWLLSLLSRPVLESGFSSRDDLQWWPSLGHL